MEIYWTPQHDAAIKDYYYSSSTLDKCNIIDKRLHKPLYEMARRCLTSLGLRPDAEKEQDIVIHLIYKTMPKLSEEKLQGAFQYLWIAARNYTLTYILKPMKVCNVDYSQIDISSCSYVYDSTTIEAIDLDAEYERQKIHKRVLDELDLKIRGQQILNATNSVFLLLLRQYIIDNDYDVRGFGIYIQKTMKLKLNTYRAICGRLGLRTRDFNEKLID